MWPRYPRRSSDREVWNDTVANLTLMALGSSAPEILLSVPWRKIHAENLAETDGIWYVFIGFRRTFNGF